MAQYYADIQGNRGEATRMGTKNSGMGGHIRGWNVGARVWMGYNEETEQDECTVSITGGSNGGRFRDLGTFTAADLETEPEEVREASCILDEEVDLFEISQEMLEILERLDIDGCLQKQDGCQWEKWETAIDKAKEGK